MIRIDRGPEPQSVKDRRRTYLSRAVLEWVRTEGGNPAPPAFGFDGYQIAKPELYRRQRRKCAYCELQVGFGSQPTEHFRPKDGALRNLEGEPRRWDRHHYWWLSWTWENLLFACATCNGSKQNRFPLEPGTAPLPAPSPEIRATLSDDCFSVSSERPLLIDPTVDEPLDHIEWRPANPGAPAEKLRWRPIHKTRRGKVTVDALGWEEMGLADHVSTHVTHVVHPRVKRLLEKMRSGDEAVVRSEWDDLVSDLFHAEMPHLAATHDALDYFVPADMRRRWTLHLPRPGIHGAHPAASAFEDPPGFADLAVTLQWELRALGERADPEKRDRALATICRFRPSTVDALSGLTGLEVQYLRGCLEKLAEDGTLTRRLEGSTVLYCGAAPGPSEGA